MKYRKQQKTMDRKLRYSITVLLLISLGIGTSLQAQNRIVTFTTENEVMLRWIDINAAEADGYYVYRSLSGEEWKRLTEQPLKRVTSEKEIERTAGYKTGLYLGLFSANEPRDLTERDYQQALSGGDASFLHLMLLTNPEFGSLMGQVYYDKEAQAGLKVRYRITALVDGTERDIVTSKAIQTGLQQSVPAVDGIEGIAGDQAATILWERNQETLDTGSVIGFNVYRSESPLGPFEQMNTLEIAPISINFTREDGKENRGEYIDKWLENGTSYYYHVRGLNLFGVESLPSPTVEVVPQNNTIPLPLSGLSLDYVGGHLVLTWSQPVESSLGVEVYRGVHREGEYEPVFTSLAGITGDEDSTNIWIDNDVLEGREYYYWGRIIGETGLKSPSSDTVSFFIEDHTPPAPPANVRGFGTSEGIEITWDANDEDDLLGYEIERASDREYQKEELITDSPVAETSWKDEIEKTSETTYGYVVYAVDESYNRSAPSRMVFAQMPDIVPPQTPIITRLGIAKEKITMEWTESPQSDLKSYAIYRKGGQGEFLRIGESKTARFIEAPEVDGKYLYAVSAIDSVGNESERSDPVSIQYVRDYRVAPPTSVVAEKKENHILVRWSNVKEAAGYVVHRRNPKTNRTLLLAELQAGETEFKDWYSDRREEHIYVVQSRDSEWRMSEEVKGQYLPEGE